MNLQEKLQQLALEREQLVVALHELTGAMKILQQQIEDENKEDEPETATPES
tara:strand:- start:83 stop:238 length:156 start_codon:yes stop_codon:yes gene_type:complete